MSSVAQRRKGFDVKRLPPVGSAYEEALQDNMQTPVPDQVAFRCDFPVWLKGLSHRNRRIVADLMAGESTKSVANKFGLTPARISELRREFCTDWDHFHESSPANEARQSASHCQ